MGLDCFDEDGLAEEELIDSGLTSDSTPKDGRFGVESSQKGRYGKAGNAAIGYSGFTRHFLWQ